MKKLFMEVLLNLQLPKIDLKMKLTTLLLIVSLFEIQASVYSQNTKLTLDFENTSLKQIFDNIESISEFRFLFESEQIDLNRKVSIKVTDNKIKDILRLLFENTDIDYRLMDRQVLLKKKEIESPPSVTENPKKTSPMPQNSVTGTVTDENGQPLPGANIVEKGTTNGTQTDFDGNYSITLTTDAPILVFSYIGFQKQERAVGQLSTVDARMTADSEGLDEVVVIGYGSVRKTDVTGSVATVSSQDIADLPVASFDQALAGQIAGVQINQSSGTPGSGVSVNIRGLGSISAGNEPLYVVDGFPISGDINTINPNDIESIDILKDASAAAIYGSRGANGVVIITTKRSKSDGVQVNVDVFSGMQQILKKVDLLDGDRFREYAVRARNNSFIQNGGDINAPDSSRPGALQIGNILATTANTDWQDEIFRSALIQNYQVSILGGNEDVKFLLSGNYFNQQGIIINSGFERFSLRANLDVNVSDNFKVGLSLTPTYNQNNNVYDNARGGVISSAVTLPSIFPVRNADGTFANSIGFTDGISGIENPVAQAELIDDNNKDSRLLSNVFAEVDLFNNFKFRTSLGADIRTRRRELFAPDNVQFLGQFQTRGLSSSNQIVNWLFDNTLTYQNTFNDNHNLSVLFGYSSQKETLNSNRIDATGFPNNNVPSLSNATEATFFNSLEESWSLLSYFARTSYDYKGKYLFNATVRRDGSSRFGANNKWGTFPSLSGAWRISEEEFLMDSEVFSNIKLRASWGKAGNFNISNFGSLGLLNPQNYVIGGNRAIGLQPSNLANPNLTWEVSAQTDFGLDVGLFNNKLNLVVDYFQKNTDDLLLQVQIPTTTGFSNFLQNLGEIKNTGWEFALNTINVSNENFQWRTSANLTAIRNEVLALGPEGDDIISGAGGPDGGAEGGVSGTHITRIGEPLGNFFGFVRDGIYLNQEEIDSNPVQDFPNRQPGDWRTKDTNGDGIIDADDRTITGSPFPDFTYGVTNTFKYKNIDFSVLLVGSQGNDILNLSIREYGNFAANNNIITEQFNGFQSPTNIGNGLPRAARNPSSNQTAISTYHVEDGSFLSVRNITLGYNLESTVSERLNLESARIYVGVQNAFLFTNFIGFNPEESIEDNGAASALSPGVSYGGYPLPRTFTLGLNLKF